MLPSLALAAVLQTQGRRAPAADALPAVSRVALRDFDAWDKDRDGALSLAEVDRASLSPWFHGEDAATLAALHIYLAAAGDGAVRLTREWFASYRPTRLVVPPGTDEDETRRLRRTYAATPASLQSEYATDLRRLTRPGATNLFVGDGPRLADVRQGQMGDCYLIAPIGAFVNRDPEGVRRMIRSDGAGGFTVAFADGKPVYVPKPTDAEIAMGGSSTDHGLWIRVIEKAYGSRDFAPDETEKRLARETTNHGGNPIRAGRSLTGNRFGVVRLVGGYRKEVLDTDVAPMLERLRRDLPRAMAERRLVLADTSNEPAPPGIDHGHAYAVFGFDPATDTITVWNPHGSDFEPKGPEGFENGFRRRGGVFAMPLPMFAHAFGLVFFEQAPASHAAR